MFNERTISVIGHAADKPSIRQAGSSNVLQVNVAATRSWMGKGGEWKHDTAWFKVKFWGTEIAVLNRIADTIAKGDLVRVVGQPEAPEAWVDREGKPQAANVVTASVLKFVAKPPKGQDRGIGDDEKLVEEEGELPF